MQPLLNIAIIAARQAGDIIVRHLESVEHLKITEKSGGSFFSEVDIEPLLFITSFRNPHSGKKKWQKEWVKTDLLFLTTSDY